MVRHIEIERPPINRIYQAMDNDLSYERDRKHEFVDKVFQRLTQKIEEDINQNLQDQNFPSSSNSSTAEENLSEDDDIDYSDNNLDTSSCENISDK